MTSFKKIEIKNIDVNHIESIFTKINDIQKFSEELNSIPIIFDSKVTFIHPFFWIMLFDLQYKVKKVLVIDILSLSEDTQHYAHRFLRQYKDFNFFEVHSPRTDTEEYRNIQIIPKDDIDIKLKEYEKFIGNKVMFFTNVEHKEIDFDVDYDFLPVLQLRRLNNLNNYDTVHEDDPSLTKKDKRVIFYKKLSLDEKDKNLEDYRVDLQNSVLKLLTSLGLSDKNLSSPLSNIFFELIDNIRKHTKEETNAHISFLKRSYDSGKYELVISDNDEVGFIENYKKTLICEKRRLTSKGIRKEEFSSFNSTIKDIKDNNIKKVLVELFSINNSINTHQIPRIAMHFGIPILLKILDKLEEVKEDMKGIKTVNKPILEIYMHKKNEFYKVTYDFNIKYKYESEDKEYVPEIKTLKYGRKGTFIYISIPKDIEVYDKGFNTSVNKVNASLKNNDYTQILKRYDHIQKTISSFSYLDSKDISLLIKPISDTKKIIVNYDSEIKYKTFSEFIRSLYPYAYKYNIEDIVVFNVPLQQSEEHLALMANIMFPDEEKKYKKSLNVVFYNKYFPSAVFLGGRTKKDFCNISYSLSTYYGQDTSFGIECNEKDIDKNHIVESSLFYNEFIDDRHTVLLPFELFEIVDKYDNEIDILNGMINNYLTLTALDIHLDTQRGYHIDKFFQFKKIFENSQWVHRIAFRLANKIILDRLNKYAVVGTDKYTSLTISLALSMLEGTGNEINKYIVLSDLETESIKRVKEFINNHTNTFLYSSVLFDGKHIKSMLIDKEDREVNNWLCGVFFAKNVADINHTFNYLFKYQISPHNILHKLDNGHCDKCDEVGNKDPLFKLSQKDPFVIEDFYIGNYKQKHANNYLNWLKDKGTDIHLKWLDSIHFTHAYRGSNHYTFYTKTINFFEDNKDNIIKFLEDVKNNKFQKFKPKKKVLILTPIHNTNNNFISLVNKIVFDNDATVRHFDKSKGEANFYVWDREYIRNNQEIQKEFIDLQETSVYFVDDEISSGYTLEYFYTLLRALPTVKNGETGFDGLFVLIDRLSPNDEQIVSNYLKNSEEYVSVKNIEDKFKYIYAFTKLEIKPIKTVMEDCFLCKRQLEYIEIFDKAALDLTRFQIARRVHRLKKKKSIDIEYSKESSLTEKIKIFIKMYAVNFVYERFDLFCFKNFKEEWNENLSIDEHPLLQEFVEEAWNHIILYFEGYSINEKELLREIIRYESFIGIIKALSFPKLVYYHDIRTTVVNVAVTLLRRLAEEFVYIDKQSIKPQFAIQTLLINKKNESTFKSMKIYKNDERFKQYIDKSNLDIVNFLYSTLGYLGEYHLLDTTMLNLYRAISLSHIRDKNKLHIYPFAVKMVINNNKETTENIINKIGKMNLSHNKLSDALVNAVFLEANSTIEIENSLSVVAEDNIEIKMRKLKDFINFTLKNNIKDFTADIKGLYISDKMGLVYKEYTQYLHTTEKSLKNVFNKFTNLDKNTELEVKIADLYYGSVNDKNTNSNDQITLKRSENIMDQIHDTWSNILYEGHTIIKLVDIDTDNLLRNENFKNNKPIWFRPIGCIVIRHSKDKQDDYNHHLLITRAVLAIQKNIVEFIKKEIGLGIFQEKIQGDLEKKLAIALKEEEMRKIQEKLEQLYADKEMLEQHTLTMQENTRVLQDAFTKNKRAFEKRLEQISHSLTRYINLETPIDVFLEDMKEKSTSKCEDYEEFLKNIGIYSYGMMLHTGLQETKAHSKKDGELEYDLYDIFNDDDKEFFDLMNKFIDIAKIMHSSFCKNCNSKTLNISELKRGSLILSFSTTSNEKLPVENLVKYIVFELIFNALKAMEVIEKPYIKFYSVSSQNNTLERGICVENVVNNDFNIDRFIESWDNKKNKGLGLKAIKTVMEQQGYEIKSTCENNILKQYFIFKGETK